MDLPKREWLRWICEARKKTSAGLRLRLQEARVRLEIEYHTIIKGHLPLFRRATKPKGIQGGVYAKGSDGRMIAICKDLELGNCLRCGSTLAIEAPVLDKDEDDEIGGPYG